MMKYLAAALLCLFLTFDVCTAEGPEKGTDVPEEEKDRISYSIGYQIGSDLKKQGMEVDTGALKKGIDEGIKAVEPRLSPEEMKEVLTELKKEIVARAKTELVEREQEQLKVKEKYRGEGRAFLAENARKKGVVVLPSGLQYEIIREGSGMIPGPNDTVTVRHRGTLLDGTEFDSSYHDDKPAEFRIDGVIKGWAEALQLMKEGAKWRLYIPADLAFGERGPLADKSVIYDIELISTGPAE